MAVLTNAERAAVTAEYQREISTAAESCSILKSELRAAVDAADTWVDSNASSFNTALPVAARTGLTSSQKARLLMFVVARRFLNGS